MFGRRSFRPYTTSGEARILGGLPVYYEARIHPPEPDIGIDYPQVEVLSLQWLSGHPLPQHMNARIDWATLQQDIVENLDDA